MKKIFLSSSFSDVSDLFSNCINEDVKGKRVTFIPTASIYEEVNFYVEAGKQALKNLGLIVDELEISTASSQEIKQKLEQNHYIYVTGGNTFFLLQWLKKTGADKIIVEQIGLGKLYIGESAGAIVLSPHLDYIKAMDDSTKGPELKTFDALNILTFYPLPHYQSFPFAEAVEAIILQYKPTLDLRPFSNAQAIFVNGNECTFVE